GGTPALLESQAYAEPRRGRRGAEDSLPVSRIDRRWRGVVRLLESPAFVEQNRPLGIENVEDIQKHVDLGSSELDRISEVDVGVIVAGGAAFCAASSEEEFVAAVSVGIAVAGERRSASPIR